MGMMNTTSVNHIACTDGTEYMEDGLRSIRSVRYTSVRGVLRCLPIIKAESPRSHARVRHLRKFQALSCPDNLARDTERVLHAGIAEYPDWMAEEGHGEKGDGWSIRIQE